MIDPASSVFKIDALGKAGILHVIGDTGREHAARLDAAIVRLAAVHAGAIFVAFGECTFADAETLRVLQRRCNDVGSRLRLVAPRDALIRELAWSSPSGLEFFDAFEDAVGAPKPAAVPTQSAAAATPGVSRAAG